MSKQEDFVVKASKDAKYEIHAIFPTPVYTRENLITDDEIPYLKEVASVPLAPMYPDGGSNLYGEKSENTYFLDQFALVKLKEKLTECLNEYANQCLGLAGEYAITQSWLSVKKPGQRHIMHSHGNSIISGVFWFENPPETQGLTFVKNLVSHTWQMMPLHNPNVNNEFSFNEVTLKVENNMVCMFPSWLAHRVAGNESKTDRYSIAFNAVPKYALGAEKELTELIFKTVDREY